MSAPDARVSDADRDRAASSLREHFAAGRLTQEELDERVHDAYRAVTQAELAALSADLPMLPVEHRAALAERRSQLQRRLLQQTGGTLVAFVVCVVIWAAAGSHHHGEFWPAWVALAALIPLVRGGWRLYGPSPELDRLERELDRRDQSRRHRRRLPPGTR